LLKRYSIVKVRTEISQRKGMRKMETEKTNMGGGMSHDKNAGERMTGMNLEE
jgi:hypothetical protein